MDLPTLIEACFNGLAKGGASALGSGLWVLTQRLICGLTSKFVTADDVSEADVLIELSDPNQMIQKMDEFQVRSGIRPSHKCVGTYGHRIC